MRKTAHTLFIYISDTRDEQPPHPKHTTPTPQKSKKFKKNQTKNALKQRKTNFFENFLKKSLVVSKLIRILHQENKTKQVKPQKIKTLWQRRRQPTTKNAPIAAKS